MHIEANPTMIISSRTFDHRTLSTQRGGPASRFQRVDRPVVRTPDRPNYAARRLGAVFVAIASVFIMVTLLNSLLVGFGGSPASAAEAAPAGLESGAAIRHVARPGDSLWSIADDHRGDISRARYVDALVQLNGGTDVVVGQAVILP